MPQIKNPPSPKSHHFVFSKLLSFLLILWMSLCALPRQVLAQSAEAEKFPDTPALDSLLNGNASFRLVLGRIVLDTKRYKVGQFRFKNADVGDSLPADTLRTVTISLEQGQPNLVLYRSTPTERWMIEARGNGRCKIQYTHSEKAYSLTWDQPASGGIKVHLEQNGIKKSFTGLSAWHLRFEDPELCSQHLFPMFLKIEPNWNLELIAKETEKRMEEVLQIAPLVTERKIQELMQEFSSNNASTRDKAHRELRSLGLAILTPLMSLNMQQLDLEQRLRVERLIQTMRPTTDDTPNRLAAWLSGDYAICQRIASKLEGDAKQQGIAYLQGLSGIESGNIIR
ncbi:MAG: hypothetical protein JNK90_05055 [Planctomycetaceae bacterium]|nr:hypothetical protein [Planctomycetaceae bacterium]